MKKKFILYVPGLDIQPIHERTPQLMITSAFSKLGYDAHLICGKYSIRDIFGIKVYQTATRSAKMSHFITEPLKAFKHIFTIKPNVLIIMTFGRYLPSILVLVSYYRFVSLFHPSFKSKVILKTDWSLDFTGLSKVTRIAAGLLLVISSRIFNRVTVETSCGVERSQNIPLLKMSAMRHIPVGVPDEAMNYSPHIRCRETNSIICVARITKSKGQRVLIDAFLLLKNKFPNWTLRFIGPIEDEKYKEELDLIISSYNSEDKIRFIGFVSQEVLYEEFKNASILCLPSIQYENAGNVRYEAAAFGIPVVTTDLPCRADNEELGFLVAKSGDSLDLAAKLETLMVCEDTRKRVGENSREKIFTYTKIAELYIDC